MICDNIPPYCHNVSIPFETYDLNVVPRNKSSSPSFAIPSVNISGLIAKLITNFKGNLHRT